jgi:hypothetical protein
MVVKKKNTSTILRIEKDRPRVSISAYLSESIIVRMGIFVVAEGSS